MQLQFDWLVGDWLVVVVTLILIGSLWDVGVDVAVLDVLLDSGTGNDKITDILGKLETLSSKKRDACG